MQNQALFAELGVVPRLRGSHRPRIGIIGAGRIAQQRQIPAYRHAGLTVAAAADIRPEALERARHDYGIDRLYGDYRELLDQRDIEIVDICTNTFPRKQITLDALSAGKHVLSEKPFARTLDDARELVHAAAHNGVYLAVHQPTRWYYPCAVTRELVVRGLLGEVFYIEIRMHGNQDTAYFNDPVTRWHADLTDHLFVEWGAHHFDLARWFAGGEVPSSVFAWGTTKGNEHFKSKMAVSATLRFDSGTCASLSLNQASRCISLPMTGMTFRVEGTLGTVAGNILDSLSFASRARGGMEASFDWSAPLPREEDPHNYLWNASTRDGHLWPMVELINAIAEGRPAMCSGEDNIATVRTYLAALHSDREYRPVRLDELDTM